MSQNHPPLGSPLLLWPGKTLILPPLLFPPLDYYAVISAYGAVAIDWDARYDKRAKGSHRYLIADVNGRLPLTVPLRKPDSLTSASWKDILISSHGSWQSVHLTALESAYGRTPYFEFYIDTLMPLYSRQWNDAFLKDYLIAAHNILAGILPLPPIVPFSPSIGENLTDSLLLRPADHSPYWQPRASQLGFIPGLSILDAIFCMGPETIPLLRSIQSR